MQTEYRNSEESKQNGVTYHLAIIDEWVAQKDGDEYRPGAFAADGFIHCTNGLDLLTDVANMFYKNSTDPRIVLVLDTSLVESELRYDDPDQQFPHIYGALNPSAVVGQLPVHRSEDGTFVRLGN